QGAKPTAKRAQCLAGNPMGLRKRRFDSGISHVECGPFGHFGIFWQKRRSLAMARLPFKHRMAKLWQKRHFSQKRPMAANTVEDVVRGDSALARAIFGDARKRKLISQLEVDGWPFFRIAGKRSAFPDDLAAEIARRRQTATCKPRARTDWSRLFVQIGTIRP